MFVVVKFGNNESLLVNPSCAVINLLTSIKRRAGYANTNKTIDLSDKTDNNFSGYRSLRTKYRKGLIKDLDVHKFESATKFLTSHETYILVQKEQLMESGDSPVSKATQYIYVPLLERYTELFPNFRIHVQEVPESRKKLRVKTGTKSPSPAGKLLGRAGKKQDGKKTGHSKQTKK